jgi:hypothetical protein
VLVVASLAASTNHPPCEQWLTGLGVARSSVIVVGCWEGCWAVPRRCGALVLGFVVVGWLSVVVVGHGVWGRRYVYDLKLMKTVSWLKETRNIKLT